SADFAGTNNTYRGVSTAFVAKTSPTGSLIWSIYLGGSGGDDGLCIAVDAAGDVLVAGTTYSADFARANNAIHGGADVFVAKISSSGSLLWATYLGGTFSDYAGGIAVDRAGNVLVTGGTISADFVGANNSSKEGFGGLDAFVAKVSPNGSLLWASYLGGKGNDIGYGIAVDAA